MATTAGRRFTNVSNAKESSGQFIHWLNIDARSIITEKIWLQLDLLDVLHAVSRFVHLILFPNIRRTSMALVHVFQKGNGESRLLQVTERRGGSNAEMKQESKHCQS